MDEKRNTGEFDLEDILREFGTPDPELEEDVLIWGEETPEKPAAVPSDTIPLEQISKAVQKQTTDLEQTVAFAPVTESMEHTATFTPVNEKMEETVVFAPVTGVTDDTVSFTPVGETLEDTVTFTPVSEEMEQTISFAPIQVEEVESVPAHLSEDEIEAEPYSENWEPEYEKPISEYVPPEPIVQRPKSRLRELKKKLVAGPERRYYELTELGLGKLQLAIFVNLLVALLSAGATALYTMGVIPGDRTRLLIFVQFLTLLISGLLGSYQLMEGFADMLRLKFSLNSLLIFSLIACLVDGVLCLQSLQVPCCAVFSLHMTMALWSAYQKRNTEMGQMDTLRKATRLDSLVSVPDYYEGQTGFLRGEGQVEDFMDIYRETSSPEKLLSYYALAALGVSVAIGITAGILHGSVLGVRAFSTAVLVSVPASAYIAISRPMAILERRLHRVGAVICGWDGVTGLCEKGAFPLTDADLFPSGSAKMNGVKFYGSRKPDTVVAYGTALISACGGGLEPLFNALLESRSGYHFTAKELRSYPAGGIGGEVNGEPVLAGSLKFMQDMGVEMPAGAKVSQAIYVAIDGELGGIFAITYHKARPTAEALATLCSYRKLTPVLTTSDFILTDSFIRSRFGVSTRRIAFPERAVRNELSQVVADEESPALALYTQDDLSGPAFAVTGARALRTACTMGVVVHMLGGILGLGMMLTLAILGAEYLLTPGNVLAYELVWMIPGLLFTEWARSV